MQATSTKSSNNAAVAILDVDNTLVFGTDPDVTYNDNLISSLKNNGISEAYLFTSMEARKDTLEDRMKLIDYLSSKGITVKGVITTSDAGYDIYCKEKIEYIEKMGDDQSKENLREYLQNLVSEKYKDIPLDLNCCVLFDTVCKEMTVDNLVQDPMRRLTDQKISEMLTAIRGHKNHDGEKGIMYELFMSKMRHEGHPYKTIVFVDDREGCLSAADETHQRFFKNDGVDLAIIGNFSKKEELVNYYDNAIYKGFNGNVPERKLALDKAGSEIPNVLNSLIQNYKSKNKNAKDISLLTEIQDVFMEKKRENLSGALTYIQNEASSILNKQKRSGLNLFSSGLQNDTLKLCNELLKMKSGDYGSIVELSREMDANAKPGMKPGGKGGRK